jgi:hypothetical protein
MSESYAELLERLESIKRLCTTFWSSLTTTVTSRIKG